MAAEEYQISISGIVWSVIGILTLTTNSLTLIFLLTRRSLRKPQYIALDSLLLSNIAFAMAYILPYYSNRQLQFDIPNWCVLLPRVGQSLFLNMSLHICLLAVIRSIQINRPFQAFEIVTTKHVSYMCLLLWVCSLTLVVISAVHTDRLQAENGYNMTCNEQFENTNDVELAFSLIILSISFFVLLLLCAIYHRILSIIDYHMKKSVLTSSITDVTIKDRIGKFINKKKTIRQALCVFSLYLVFLGPFLITLGLSYIDHLYTPVMTVFPIFRYLAFCYPIVLPCIYIAFDNEIRVAIYRMFNRNFDSINTPTTDQTLNDFNNAI